MCVIYIMCHVIINVIIIITMVTVGQSALCPLQLPQDKTEEGIINNCMQTSAAKPH